MTIALSRSCLAGVCLLLSGLPFAHAADTRLFAGQSGTLDIAGGTAHIPVVEDVARQVGRANPQVRITVTGGGSGVGIQKVGEGLVDIGSTGRAPSEAEIQRYDLKPFRFALDGVAIAVHPSNPVGNLSMEQARDIFSGKIDNWKQVAARTAASTSMAVTKPAPPAKCLSARCWARTCSQPPARPGGLQRGGQDGHCP